MLKRRKLVFIKKFQKVHHCDEFPNTAKTKATMERTGIG
jgi:hypothetical protein